jgi:hypothetical protein
MFPYHQLSQAPLDNQHTHRIFVSAVASALFGPRPSDNLHYLYRPVNPTGRRLPSYQAEPCLDHSVFLIRNRDFQLRRGIQTRKRIMDVVRQADVLNEAHQNLEGVDDVLRDALRKARDSDCPQFVSLGLVAPPNVTKAYIKEGYAPPGIKWANFKPALLKISWTSSRNAELQVIEIKSTENYRDVSSSTARSPPLEADDDHPHQIDRAKRFQLRTYRHFLLKLIPSLGDPPSRHKPRRKSDLLDHLRHAPTSALWTYTGCYSDYCCDMDGCFLNRTGLSPHEMEENMIVEDVKPERTLTKDVLYWKVPSMLGAKRLDDDEYRWTGGREDNGHIGPHKGRVSQEQVIRPGGKEAEGRGICVARSQSSEFAHIQPTFPHWIRTNKLLSSSREDLNKEGKRGPSPAGHAPRSRCQSRAKPSVIYLKHAVLTRSLPRRGFARRAAWVLVSSSAPSRPGRRSKAGTDDELSVAVYCRRSYWLETSQAPRPSSMRGKKKQKKKKKGRLEA